MASVAIIADGALLKAVAFTDGNFLPVFFLAMTHRLPSKRKRHDEALEDYQAAYVKYEKQRTKLLDWIKTQHENNYNRVHQDEPLTAPSEPKFSDFY